MVALPLLLLGPIVGCLVGYAIGQGKGRGALGFWLGLFLGFIGWIIVACMAPTEEHEARQGAVLTDAVAGSLPTSPAAITVGPTRSCPFCAEDIKAAARVCRFCGRDLEPLSTSELELARVAQQEMELQRVGLEHPSSYPHARPHLDALGTPPAHPVAWLEELCVRVEAGSPPDRAAARIPLDWASAVDAPPTVMTVVPNAAGIYEYAGDYPSVSAAFPAAYDQARLILAGLTPGPERPERWLAELCQRMHNGSSPQAAAARIPLNWGVEPNTAHPSGTATAGAWTCGACGAPNRQSAKFCGSCGRLRGSG